MLTFFLCFFSFLFFFFSFFSLFFFFHLLPVAPAGVRVRIGLGGVGGDAGRAAGIGLVRSSVTGIVRPFAAGWSVWAAGLCVEGLLLAVISLFVTNVPAALGLTIALHLASTVPQLPMTRALLSQTHRFLALGCRLALVCLALFGILLDTGSVSNPDTGGAIIVALMFALPLLGLVVGAVLELRVDKCVTQCLEGDFQSLATTNAVRKQAIVMGFAAAKRREIESEERARISEYKRSKLASLSKDPAAVAEHHDEDAAMFDEDEDIPRDPHLESLRATDRALDRLGADFITSYFMFVGVVAFLALCIVLVGIVYASTTSEFIPQAPLTSSSDPAFINNHEFANYADWTEFRQECCCSVGTLRGGGGFFFFFWGGGVFCLPCTAGAGVLGLPCTWAHAHQRRVLFSLYTNTIKQIK
jgi:hypothetical protein